jgi:hypothetical protein
VLGKSSSEAEFQSKHVEISVIVSDPNKTTQLDGDCTRQIAVSRAHQPNIDLSLAQNAPINDSPFPPTLFASVFLPLILSHHTRGGAFIITVLAILARLTLWKN